MTESQHEIKKFRKRLAIISQATGWLMKQIDPNMIIAVGLVPVWLWHTVSHFMPFGTKLVGSC